MTWGWPDVTKYTRYVAADANIRLYQHYLWEWATTGKELDMVDPNAAENTGFHQHLL